MKPGKLDEQPMPLMVTTLWFGICSSTSAFWTAESTPKSPQPGHQSGSTLPLKSVIFSCSGGATPVAIFIFSSNHDFVRGNGKFRFPRELFLDRLNDVVRHERFAIVLANVAVRHVAGFAAQITRKLATEVVLDNDGVPRAFQNVENRFAMQRDEPADLQLIGRDSLFPEDLTGFLDHPFGRPPADQGNVSIAGTHQYRRRNGSLNADHLAHALLHHGTALDRICVLVADQHAIFIVFVRAGGVGVAGHSWNSARRNTALRDQVALVTSVRGNSGGRPVARAD